MVLNYILSEGGLQPSDVSVIGVGTSAGAVAAMRAGQIDAIVNSDPVITILLQHGDAVDAIDMRSPATSDAVFGGPYPEASVYTTAAFAAKNPHTMQAVANAVVKAEQWMAKATPDQIADALPEEYLLGDRPTYINALNAMRSCYSPDGLMSKAAAETVLKILRAFDDSVRDANINIEATYDNHFVEHATGRRKVRLQPAAAVELKNVTCQFRRATGGGTYTAVSDVNLRIEDAEFVAVVGPTGCGKSTLLNVASGLLEPSSGDVLVFGKPLAGLNRKSAYLFQADALMPWRTALDNIAAGLLFRNMRKAEAEAQARDWLARVGLRAHADRYPHQMSGGMRKRVALAQALILDPPILLMDEPFSALDIQTRQLMEDELLQLWSVNRKSVIFVTHDLEEAISLADRVVVLAAGPGTRPVAEFSINLPRPREVSEIRMTQEFLELHTAIWQVLKKEVLKSHAHAQG